MINKYGSRLLYIGVVLIVAAALLFSVISSRMFSAQNGIVSNRESQRIATYIENKTAEIFPINRSDTFWRTNLNQIVRKAAHLTEYMFIGIFACLFFNLVIKNIGLSFLISVILCPILAYFDENSQKTVMGRTSQMFDIKLDTLGSYIGIIIITLGAIIVKYIMIKRRDQVILPEKPRRLR